ncbi:hypothetical protein K0M31_013885 [Melipona bicolor]|uniref:Uncharacterized protein n=1 Tax=Melipona bicolor TaxID=60889 RepID=A0AA40G7F8_9HYME|nr:hypothetical protein K0M31_013885 [Melipona bicolor]
MLGYSERRNKSSLNYENSVSKLLVKALVRLAIAKILFYIFKPARDIPDSRTCIPPPSAYSFTHPNSPNSRTDLSHLPLPVPIYRSDVYHFKEGRGHSFDRAGRYTGGIVGGCEEPSGDYWQEQRDPTRNGNVTEKSLSAFEQNAGERREQESCRLVQDRIGTPSLEETEGRSGEGIGAIGFAAFADGSRLNTAG